MANGDCFELHSHTVALKIVHGVSAGGIILRISIIFFH